MSPCQPLYNHQLGRYNLSRAESVLFELNVPGLHVLTGSGPRGRVRIKINSVQNFFFKGGLQRWLSNFVMKLSPAAFVQAENARATYVACEMHTPVGTICNSTFELALLLPLCMHTPEVYLLLMFALDIL